MQQYIARREINAENMSKEKSSKRDYDGEKLVEGFQENQVVREIDGTVEER